MVLLSLRKREFIRDLHTSHSRSVLSDGTGRTLLENAGRTLS
jgi:hypothetical protein